MFPPSAALAQDGYWLKLLSERGVLDLGTDDARQLAPGQYSVNGQKIKVRSGYLVNRILSQLERWESIFTVFRDLEPLFDHINLSTALHRLAKASHKQKVRPLSPPRLFRLYTSLHLYSQGRLEAIAPLCQAHVSPRLPSLPIQAVEQSLFDHNNLSASLHRLARALPQAQGEPQSQSPA